MNIETIGNYAMNNSAASDINQSASWVYDNSIRIFLDTIFSSIDIQRFFVGYS